MKLEVQRRQLGANTLLGLRCLANLVEVPSWPSAVLSIKTTCPACTVFSAPVRTSLAFSGNWAQSLPYSETCRSCSVPDRSDVRPGYWSCSPVSAQ